MTELIDDEDEEGEGGKYNVCFVDYGNSEIKAKYWLHDLTLEEKMAKGASRCSPHHTLQMLDIFYKFDIQGKPIALSDH